MKRLLGCLFFLIILFQFSLAGVRAFSDEFQAGDLDNNIWDAYNNSGIVSLINGKLKLSSNTNPSSSSPYVRSVADIFPSDGPYRTGVSYQYVSTGGFGNGIVFSKGASPENGHAHDENGTTQSVFGVWQDKYGGLNIYTWICADNTNHCNGPRIIRRFALNDLGTHQFLIEQTSDNRFRLFADGGEEAFYESGSVNFRLKSVWFGHSEFTHTNDKWSSFDVEYIRITDLDQEEEPEARKIVVLPGGGASWDFGALLNGTSGNNWQVPEFVDLYNNLINSINNNGYEMGTDLFLFGYDWRKTLDSLADDFKTYLDSLQLADGEKVNLVGHSMGGLVARTYAQKYGTDKINRIVTMGSPHKGWLDAYFVWEGAGVWGNIWWEKAALELTIHLNNQAGDSRVETLRSQAPGFKDLLPTYDYLKVNGQIKPWGDMAQKNTFLDGLNQDQDGIDPITKAYAGVGRDTRSILKATTRTNIDRLLGRWEDGRPISGNPFEYAIGDDTVIRPSAGGVFSSIAELNNSHVGLAYEKEGVESVLTELGLDPTKASTGSADTRNEFLALALRSPGRLKVCDESGENCDSDLGLYFPDSKLFLLPGYDGEKLSASVIEDGTGVYDLHIGRVGDEEDWEVIKGSLTEEDQEDEYIVEERGGEVVVGVSDETEERNEAMVADDLSSFSAGWDRGGYFAKAGNEQLPENTRLKYIRLARVVLRQEFKKAVRQNSMEYLQSVGRVWDANDRLADDLLRGKSSYQETKVSSYHNRVTKQMEQVNKKLVRSSRALTGMIYEMAREKLESVNAVDAGDTNLKIDRLMSTEYLLYSVLDNI